MHNGKMKSNNEQLKNRGYLPVGFEKAYSHISYVEKLELLKSNIATDRTLGARLLSQEISAVAELIQALKVEKKLYPKIEICNALISIGAPAVKPLIKELGAIGNNQYTSIPEKEFGKNNYPLPHDIVARTLAFMGEPSLPELLNAVENEKQLSEAIDAVGYICFYNPHPEVYSHLVNCWKNNTHHPLICWKIIRALSGFAESVSFLTDLKSKTSDKRIVNEIERSLNLINKRVFKNSTI